MAALLDGVSLVRVGEEGGEKQSASDALKGKTVALYFSAQWCPPCARFTPILKEFYEEVDGPFEVVWVSSDDSPAQFSDYGKHHGPWLAVPYENVDLRSKLKQQFGVCAGKEQSAVGVTNRVRGIPTLAVIKNDGSLITLEGDEVVEKKGPPILKTWQKAASA